LATSQIGNKPNRQQAKSATSQIGNKPNRQQAKSAISQIKGEKEPVG
jgi:hypothetical protein